MATILSSRYVAGIRTEVEKLEKSLNVFSDTLDEWMAVQKGWMYLESIFSAPDIQRQLPKEAKAFFMVRLDCLAPAASPFVVRVAMPSKRHVDSRVSCPVLNQTHSPGFVTSVWSRPTAQRGILPLCGRSHVVGIEADVLLRLESSKL